MTLRQATVADLPAVHALEVASFGDTAYTLPQLRQWLDLCGPLMIVAPGDHGVDGYVLGSVAHDGAGWVLALAVAPAARGKGCGRALTEAVLAALDARRVPVVHLTATPDNARALHLYRSLGFVGDTVHVDYYGPGEDRVRLTRVAPR